MSPPAILAVDGGASKIDAAVLSRDGSVLACTRVRHSGDDLGHVADVAVAVAELRRALDLESDARVARLGIFCLADADLPADDRRILRAIDRQGWTDERILRNDTFAVLRAGTDRPWGVGIVCGHGINCSAVSPDGRTFRLPALGWIAGDWGGGEDIGISAQWHAMRSQDGRGERTELERTVPAHFGLERPRQVMEAIHFGRLDEDRVAELPPVVFRAARDGDAVARSIVDRQADEIVAMAATAIRRRRMMGLDVQVVLGGGLFRNPDRSFVRRIEAGIRDVAPAASIVALSAPPVVGAALIGLDEIGAAPRAKERTRVALTHERLRRRLARRGKG